MKFLQIAEIVSYLEFEKDFSNSIDQLVALFNDVTDHDVQFLVYLLQGRIRETYIERRVGYGFIRPLMDSYRLPYPKKIVHDNNQIISSLSSFIKTKPSGTSTDINQVYKVLNDSNYELDAWLCGLSGKIPSALIELCKDSIEIEVNLIAKILYGPVVDEQPIIEALARIGKGGVGATGTLKEIFKYSIPDLGNLAKSLKKFGFANLALNNNSPIPGIPIIPQSITRWESSEEAWKKNSPCFVQPKFDGWQIQIHKNYREVRIFNRHKQELTNIVQDLVEPILEAIKVKSAILDCEMVGIDLEDNGIKSWQQTLSAKKHKVFVHNLILWDGQDYREKKYKECRKLLIDELGTNPKNIVSFVIDEFVSDYPRFGELYDKWMSHKDTEGIILKSPDGTYRSGRETKTQGKLKPTVSLDVIILGYKLSKNLIPTFMVGVWDNERTSLIPIGGVEGVISGDWESLLKRCELYKSNEKPKIILDNVVPAVWVEPMITIEILTDGIRKISDKYKVAGYSLNKKKSIRIREDKSIEDADDLTEFLKFRLPPGKKLSRRI